MKKRGLAAAFKSITLEDSSRVIFRRRSSMKNKKKKIVTAVVVYSLICVLAGCRFKKEIEFDATKERENSQEEIEKNENETSEEKSKTQDENTHIYADTLNVKRMGIDLDYFVQIFLGTSTIEEAEKYKPKHSLGDYYYEMDGKTIVYTNTGGITYVDATDGAGDCYDSIVNSLGYFSNGMGNSFRQLCPDENLDTCTKEQAIEACSKYAQACGYGSDCDITVYAFTLDAIEKVNKVFADSISAPGEGFDIVTKGQVEELRDEGKDEEAEKMDEQLHSATSRGLPWKKEHEAMVLYYRSEINGLLMDSHESGLEIVYVPYMDKIVLISGYTPYEQIADSETNELISEKVAMSQAAQTLGIRTQDDIQIDAVSLVYAMQYAGTDQMCAVPAWKVDYVLKNVDENTQIRDPGSLLIDAVSGFVADYWKQD